MLSPMLSTAPWPAIATGRRGSRNRHRVAFGLQRRLDRGMEVEAHGEAAAGPAGELILAAEIVAVGGEKSCRS